MLNKVHKTVSINSNILKKCGNQCVGKMITVLEFDAITIKMLN
jgi:hypothetical protein